MVKNIIFSILIITTSSLTIYVQISNSTPDYLTLLNAGVGILAVLLVLLRWKVYNFLITLWIIAQLGIIDLSDSIPVDLSVINLGTYTLTKIDFSQYLTYLLPNASFEVGIGIFQLNLVGVGYLLLWLLLLALQPVFNSSSGSSTKTSGMKVKASELVGQTFQLRLFRWNQLLEHMLPQQVKILQRIDFKDNPNWLLVQFSKPIKFRGGKVVRNALIKPKDDKYLYKEQPGQLAYFRLIKNINDLKTGNFDLSKTKWIDWVLVR